MPAIAYTLCDVLKIACHVHLDMWMSTVMNRAADTHATVDYIAIVAHSRCRIGRPKQLRVRRVRVALLRDNLNVCPSELAIAVANWQSKGC